MKRKLVCLSIILLLSLSFVSSQQDETIKSTDEVVTDAVESVNDLSGTLSDKNATTNYLKQEWTEALNKTGLGRFILGINSVLKGLSPVFKAFIGLEFSMSWIFFLTLLVWIGIIVLIHFPLNQILQINKWLSLGIATILATLGSQTGIIPIVLNLFSPIFTNNWIIFLSICIGLIILYAYRLYMRAFGAKIREKTKRDAEKIREQKSETVEKIHDIETRKYK